MAKCFLLLLLAHMAFSAVIDAPSAKLAKPKLPPKEGRSLSGDTDILYDAIQAEDHESIMNVLTQHNLKERLQLIEYYSLYYDHDLVEDLQEILSGDFENVVVAMLTPTTEYYAGEIYNAVLGIGTDEASLTEILITLDNDQITEASKFYYNAHQETVEAAIIDDTSGFFKDFLVAMSKADRDEGSSTDETDALEDVEAIADNSTSFTIFNDIFTHRSYAQLGLIFKDYKDLTGEPIETTIDDNFTGDIKDGLLAIVKKVQDEPAYFAQRFYESMEGWGTEDTVLIRLAVTRSEIDIEDIKSEYKDRYSVSLANAIIDETSGDYQKCLLLLIGE